MDFGNVFMAAICLLCALVFGAIASWAMKRSDPIHFWTGAIVKPEEISDIPAYNRENGNMWLIYAACIAGTGMISLFNQIAGVILLGVVGLSCIVIL